MRYVLSGLLLQVELELSVQLPRRLFERYCRESRGASLDTDEPRQDLFKLF